VITLDASGKWENLDGMGEDILAELRTRGEGLMWKAGARAQLEVKNTLKGTRSGTPYLVPGTDQVHVGAAEGEPPGTLHGHLANSVGFSPPAWSGSELSLQYGPGLGVAKDNTIAGTYSMRLEYGGVHTMPKTVTVRFIDGWRSVKAGTVIRTKPHPYMEPSAERLEPILTRLFEDSL
jgi:hypothetical protein